jgi:two-component SAPR family response regulator
MTNTEQLSLKGLKVLVVEDNYVLAESMRWALQGLGCEVVGPVPTTEKALKLMGSATIDVAILDIDLQGLSSTPIARKLGELGLPFLFLTGYESVALLPDDLHEVRCLTKPVDPDVLAQALLEQMRDHEQGS